MVETIQIKKKDSGTVELPDGSLAYSMEKAIEEYKKIKPVKYSAIDLILFLLYAQDKPVRSRTVLFKELFVFEQQIFQDESIESCKFVPYYYGPYSFYIASKLESLVTARVIEVSKKLRGVEEYHLTEKGERMIKQKYNRLPIRIRNRMEKLRKGLDQHGVKNILKAIYKKPEYQRYIVKSKVAHRYKLITWGKSRLWSLKTSQ